MQITISLDPIIFELGMFQLRWYSLAIVIAIGVAVWFVARESRRKGIDDAHYGDIAVWAIVGGILGARIFHIVDRLGYYLDNPDQVLHIMSGGLAIYGWAFDPSGVNTDVDVACEGRTDERCR